MKNVLNIIPFNYIFLAVFSVFFFIAFINGIYSFNLINENVYYIVKISGLFALGILFLALPFAFLLIIVLRNLLILKFIYSLPDNCFIEKRDEDYFISSLENSSMHEKLKIAEDFPDKIKIPKILKRSAFNKMIGYNTDLTGRFEKLNGKFYLVFDKARYKFSLMSSSIFKDFYSIDR